MSAIGLRGHQPHLVRFTATDIPNASVGDPTVQDGARVHGLSGPQPTARLIIRNTSAAEAVRVYWRAADLGADDGTYPAFAASGMSENRYHVLEPASEFDAPVEVKEFWVRVDNVGGGGTAGLECLFLYRRG